MVISSPRSKIECSHTLKLDSTHEKSPSVIKNVNKKNGGKGTVLILLVRGGLFRILISDSLSRGVSGGGLGGKLSYLIHDDVGISG